MAIHDFSIVGLDYDYCKKCKKWIPNPKTFKELEERIPKDKTNSDYLIWLHKVKNKKENCK